MAPPTPSVFLDTHVSLAPTHVCLSVGKSYFRISILSASLVALREKLKREDPNYFSILGLGKISRNWSVVIRNFLRNGRVSVKGNLHIYCSLFFRNTEN